MCRDDAAVIRDAVIGALDVYMHDAAGGGATPSEIRMGWPSEVKLAAAVVLSAAEQPENSVSSSPQRSQSSSQLECDWISMPVGLPLRRD